MNQVILVGRLGQDPDTRTMANGDDVTNLSMATSERWKDKNGQKQERTEWHKVVLFGAVAGIAAKYLSKGDQALVQGQIRTRSWEDQSSGQKRYATEIVVSGPSGRLELLGSGKGQADGGGAAGGGRAYSKHDDDDQGEVGMGREPMARAPHPDYDDDIPF